MILGHNTHQVEYGKIVLVSLQSVNPCLHWITYFQFLTGLWERNRLKVADGWWLLGWQLLCQRALHFYYKLVHVRDKDQQVARAIFHVRILPQFWQWGLSSYFSKGLLWHAFRRSKTLILLPLGRPLYGAARRLGLVCKGSYFKVVNWKGVHRIDFCIRSVAFNQIREWRYLRS